MAHRLTLDPQAYQAGCTLFCQPLECMKIRLFDGEKDKRREKCFLCSVHERASHMRCTFFMQPWNRWEHRVLIYVEGRLGVAEEAPHERSLLQETKIHFRSPFLNAETLVRLL